MRRYGYLLAVLVLALVLSVCSVAKGENSGSGNPYDNTKHVMGSALLNVGIYGILYGALGMPKWLSLGMAAGLTTVVGGLKEMTDAHGADPQDMLDNAKGTGLSAIGLAILF